MEVLKTLRKTIAFHGPQIGALENVQGSHCKLKQLENIAYSLYRSGMSVKQAKVYSKLVYAKIMYRLNEGNSSTIDYSTVPF